MCGFTGFINSEKSKKRTIELMATEIISRGPDEGDYYIDENIALGFRRLSIIDLEGGSQPLFNEDKTMVLVFNGEIYNYKEIKDELIKKGHKFTTKTDSEILIHGYEEYGEKLLQKLRGMYSFVIWDKKKKELFGARDIFGIKPFYYSKMNDTFMFGSEIKSFLKHPKFKKELNEKALFHYLMYQYSALDEAFFKNVYKLKPGHFIKIKDNKIRIKKYYSVEFNANDDLTLEETVAQIKEVMKDSVDAHKIADVEVGSFLSSGVDSSYIASLADIDKTFTVGFAAEKYSEISFAKDLSKKIGVENHSKVITKNEFFKEFPKIQYYMDEPLADPAAVPLYFVAKEASKHVKVVLSGEGADELFGGYNIYQEPIATSFYPKLPFPIKKAIGTLAHLLPDIKGKNYLIRRSKKCISEYYIGNAFIFKPMEIVKTLKLNNFKFSKQHRKNKIVDSYCPKLHKKDEITQMQYIDIHTWLVGDILQKADKMSMANSLEVRVPFLDKKVLELALTIPSKYKVNKKETKIALRRAAEEVVPTDAYKKKKLGFPVPIRVWLKEDDTYKLVKEYFTSQTANKYFNEKELLKLLNRHKEGKKDNSRKIWTIYTFLVWYDEYFA